MRAFRFSFLLRCAFVSLPLVMTACENLDWFDEKKTPLAGDRKPLFPSGVPGVSSNAPVLQPSNSNIPIDTQISATGQTQVGAQPGDYQKEPDASNPKPRTARTARNTTQSQPQPQQPPQQQPKSAAQPGAADDPWADSRTPTPN
jgi:hypothetical protein